MSELQQLFNKHGCDKSKKHKYHEVYEPDFSLLKDQPINLLEVGIFKGNSVEAWIEYFPNATIYGVDIFTRVVPNTIPILKHPRVKWLKADSLNPEQVAQIGEQWPGIRFDVIIDDGLHTPAANAKTLQNLWKYLKTGGQYYIEDVWPIDIMTTKQMQHSWVLKYPQRYNLLEMSIFLNAVQSLTSNVTQYDLRDQTGEPDSYIYKLIK